MTASKHSQDGTGFVTAGRNKTSSPHVSGIFSAHHQELSTVRSAMVSFMQVFDDCFQAQSGWNWFCYERP